MDIGLKSAFIISAIIHACIAAPLYNQALLRHDFEKKDAVIVDYLILKEMTNFAPANIGNKESIAVRETPKADIKTAPTENKASVKHDKLDYRKRLKAIKLREEIRTAEKKDAQIRSTKDYISYYGFLKEKIRTRLQENYKFYKGEGDVYLSFVLSVKGALLSYNIDRARSSNDEVLLQVTRASLMAVAPFPPLPKAISTGQLTFNITISFKK